jgi:hypothetical protein
MSENGEQENQPEENQENQSQNNELINQDENNNQGIQDLKEDSSKKLTHGHELLSEEENKKYFLEFINKNDLIKILLKEKDIFPYKTYELLTSLEELKPKNEYFSNFNSTKELIDELNNPNSTINFTIIKKQSNILELIFIFPIEGEDNSMEIELTANNIKDREMFRQLFEKYQSIKQEQEEDVAQLKNRMNAIEEILNNMQREQEELKEKERLEKERLEQERLEKERQENEHNEEENNKNEDENKENDNKKDSLGNKKGKLNEIKFSKDGSKKSFQKEKDKNIKKGKPEKKKARKKCK